MKLFREFNEEKLEQLRRDPYFAKTRETLRRRGEEYLNSNPPRILFSQIHEYVVTGNRTNFQAVHSNYQSRMETFFILWLLDEDEKYLSPLADIIWNICDFESWSIPAHVNENLTPARRRVNLDLCSTILAFRLAERPRYLRYLAGAEEKHDYQHAYQQLRKTGSHGKLLSLLISRSFRR